MELKEKLALLEETLDIEEGTLTPETALDDLEEWDFRIRNHADMESYNAWMEQLQGRTLLATTHREEDVDLLRGKKIYC